MKKIRVSAVPHQGFDTYRRGGQVFGKEERTLEVRTDFEGLERLLKRQAKALEELKDEDGDFDEDAADHLKVQHEAELETERVKQLGPDQVTPTQVKALQDDPRIKFVTAKAPESEAPPPPAQAGRAERPAAESPARR